MGRSRPGRRKRTALTVLAVFGIVLFSALGIWQVERRSWKLALIEAVDARVQASPVSAPPPTVWPSIERERHAYLHVVARGRFLGFASKHLYRETRAARENAHGDLV